MSRRNFALVAGLACVLNAWHHGVCDSLLRALLGQRVNELILEKAALDAPTLSDFEDSEFYAIGMTRARREASSRPLSLVKRSFGLVQNAISLVLYGGLLVRLLGVDGRRSRRWRRCPCSSPRRGSPRTRSELFRWRAPERRASKPIWRRSSLAKITRRK